MYKRRGKQKCVLIIREKNTREETSWKTQKQIGRLILIQIYQEGVGSVQLAQLKLYWRGFVNM
jgi:hypothetical protein